jgi:hypothetical protein
VKEAGRERSGEERARGLKGGGEGKEQKRGGKGEAGPGGERTEPAGAEQADGERDLAAGRAGQGLGDGDEFGVGLGRKPAAAFDELSVEVAKMGDGTAKREASETEKGGEDFKR